MGKPETETAILFTAKKDKHFTYRYSEKGKARDYRRYKKRLLNNIAMKVARVAKLEKELQCSENQILKWNAQE